MNHLSTYAIIPAAGRGTRLRPVTRWVPKELLPAGGDPMLLQVLNECFEADIEQVALVISPDKPLLKNVHQDLDRLSSEFSRSDVTLCFQQTPDGLADALRIGWNALGTPDQPVFSVLPDNLTFHSEANPIQTLNEYARPEADYTTILHPVTRSERQEYGFIGIPDLEQISERLYSINQLPEKKEQNQNGFDEQDTILRSAGRSLLTPTFFDILNDIEPELRASSREIDDVPVVKQLIRNQQTVQGVRTDYRIYDVGHQKGMATAWKASHQNSQHPEDG